MSPDSAVSWRASGMIGGTSFHLRSRPNMISVKTSLAKNVLSNPKLIAAASAASVDFTTLWIFFECHSIMFAVSEPSRILPVDMRTARPICDEPFG